MEEEEEVIDVDMELTIAQAMRQFKGKNNKKKKTQPQPEAAEIFPPIFSEDSPAPEIEVALFDYSVENHFKAMDRIAELCGDSELEFDGNELQRLSSSITFLREWKHFNYKPRVIRFSCQSANHQGKDVSGEINLPQFSAAIVPKKGKQTGNAVLSESGKDFVMYVGGSVWALDWCPAVHQNNDSHAKSEFLAVAAHPPDSSYHKIGAPLTGRGLIQIWCLLNDKFKEEYVPSQPKKISIEPQKPRGRPRKRPVSDSEDDAKPKKKKGRPRKKPASESEEDTYIDIEQIDASLELVPNMEDSGNTHDQVATKYSVRKKKISGQAMSAEPQQTHGNIGIIEIKSPAKKKTGERPKRFTRSQHDDQYVSVQSPEVNTSDSEKETESPQRRIKGGRPKKNSRDALEGKNMETLAVEYPESTSCPINEVGTYQKKFAKSDSSGKQDSSQLYTGELKQNSTKTEKVLGISAPSKKTQGRPRKSVESECEYVEPLAVQPPENIPSLLHVGEVVGTPSEHTAEDESIRKQTGSRLGVVNENIASTTSSSRALKSKARKRGNEHENNLPLSKEGRNESIKNQAPSNCSEVGWLNESVTNNGHLKTSHFRCSSCKDVEIPRPVMCLAHNGKVAWDAKWRPSDSSFADSKHRMGYLAVLLGNGALEVWDVPSPHAVKVIYSDMQKDGTDPRFIKLNPVFKCSKLTSGDRQSVPLAVEWSASLPHDLILAGCHDGVVALWKFSANVSSKDTRPLLCFSADTVPIRSLAWAPCQSDPESANVIVTAGHGCLKFWDIRDPFHPLWDLNPIQKVICSLDWVPDPSAIIISYEDGTIRILSLSEAANNVPVTGKPFVGTLQEGLHRYCCSSYTIWSIQVSRITGMVAYCSADGTVLRFQLTTKAVGRDPLRHRAPHFLCGSLIEEDSTLTMYTPLPDIPLLMKKPSNQEKRVKMETDGGQTSNQQALALCYGDDPGNESGSEDMMAKKSKKSSKSKTKSSTVPNASQTLVCRDDDPEPVQLRKGNATEENDKFEILPSKIIAMHRVRWNMNKGSERWLCYGGASGIVRCQEI